MIDPRRGVRDGAGAIERAARDVVPDPFGPLRPGDFFAFGWRTVAGKRKPGHCGLVVSVPGYDGPTPASVIDALDDIARAVWYDLGGAGIEDDGRGDCSGWLMEKLGVKRVQPCAGWSSINTSAAIADGTGPQRIFRRVTGPIPWAACGVVDCSSAHPKGRAVGRRAGGGALWARSGVALRVI